MKKIFKDIIKKIEFLEKAVEILICIIILAAVVCGFPDLIRFVSKVLFLTDFKLSYDAFNEFLKYALALIVGIELIEMVLTRSHESILSLILFVIARKMLVYSAGMVDILIGAIAISLIFVIIKFVSKDDKLIATLDNTFPASISLKKIEREYDLQVPTGMSNTLGGLIYELAVLEEVDEIKEKSSFVYGSYLYTVVTMKNGVILRVRIEDNIK